MRKNVSIILSVLIIMGAFIFWGLTTHQHISSDLNTVKSDDVKVPYGGASQKPLYSDKDFLNRMSPYPVMHDDLQYAIALPGLQGAWSLKAGQASVDKHQLIKVDTLDPQGIAVSRNEIFVSAYDHAHKANSVIYVLNKWTGRYIKTLVLQYQDHAGGISYDSDHQLLWVAGHNGKDSVLYGIAQADIDSYDIRSKLPIGYQQDFTLKTAINASTVAYYDGALWVGYFTRAGLGNVQKFAINGDSNATLMVGQPVGDKDPSIVAGNKLYESVPELQGISANSNHVMITSSFSNADSKLVRFNKGDDGKMTNGMYVTMPPFLEGVNYDGDTDRFYALFESATPVYRIKTKAVVDRIVYIDPKTFNKYALPYKELRNSLGMDLATNTSQTQNPAWIYHK
ncbi:hypothetical protein [Weissella confusa]|uniref:hypothetical protein n=1 Tax=Weissella confusa TaxID=1583 RepID=UPI0032DA0782